MQRQWTGYTNWLLPNTYLLQSSIVSQFSSVGVSSLSVTSVITSSSIEACSTVKGRNVTGIFNMIRAM